MMKNIQRLLLLVILSMLGSCKNYLDVVPDNIATIDNAFTDKTQAEKYLFTCYSYLPVLDHPQGNPAFYSGDEFWIFWPIPNGYSVTLDPYNIARGFQNRANPLLNFWDGGGVAKPLWQGIRVCNIFLENIDKVTDLDSYLKKRWIAEVKFLKAYYHWYLLRMYGPIPIIDVNLPISASSDQVKVKREPVDNVVQYISGLIDSAVGDSLNIGLPVKIDNLATELGRITKPIALSIKAQVLTAAASPLFNGNSDYANFNNLDGKPFFNSTYDATKWDKAAAACKAAITSCELAGISLYEFKNNVQVLSDRTKVEMSIRNAVCEKWNNELIWGYVGNGSSANYIQQWACPNLDPSIISLSVFAHLAPPLKMAELFYTENGVPINEDKTWDYANRFNLRTTTATDSAMIQNYQTVGLHFNREPRFYADMAFDGSKWFMQNATWDFKCKSGQNAGKKQSVLYSVTGYYAKKLVNWNTVLTTGGGVNFEVYPWPVMRLGDLYLMYAEASNEAGDNTTSLTYLNKVRTRAGLKSVESSWTDYSNTPGKYQTKDGLRDIVHQERLIEMAFEGSRFWDLKRWKKSAVELNKPIFGWDIIQSDYANYNRKVLLYNQQFTAPRDYLWPLAEYDLTVNSNLVQNPGW